MVDDMARLPLSKRIGPKVSEHRKANRWTQEELAVKLGVQHETISRIERGATTPSLIMLEKIADAFSIGLVDLLDNEKPLRNNEKPITKSNNFEKIADWLKPLSDADLELVLQTIKPICRLLQKNVTNKNIPD